ncbi:hypothetical protein K8R78_01220 [bacterium]|nr:hypothetical protein [bacterium]
MKPSLIITVLLVATLLLFSCDEEERQPAPAGQAPAGAETSSTNDGEQPAGTTDSTAIGFHNHSPYTIFTPSTNWIDHTQGGTPFFVRVEEIGSNNELAYLEVYPLYDLPEVVEDALWLGLEPDAALEEYLRELVIEMVPDAELTNSQSVTIDGYSAARLTYESELDEVAGGRAPIFSEVTLVLVGRRLHLVEAYCYAELTGQLHQELTILADHLLIDPPPPPPVVLTEEELAALELAEGEAGTVETIDSEAADSPDEASEIE